jgi:hypothetical protein
MKAKRILIAFALITAMQMSLAGMSEAHGKAKEGRTLTGSWTVDATPAPETGMPHFLSLATATRDGGIVNSNSPGEHATSSGHGRWIRTRSGEFAITFIHMHYDATGQFAGTLRVRASVTLDGDGNGFSGPFKTDIFDAGGNLLLSFGGTVSATRISVVPLD